MSKPRDLSKLFTSNTNITTDAELISTVNSASAYALSEANDYTDSSIENFEALPSQSGNANKYLSTSGSVTSWEELDLNAAIVSASTAAYSSASAYTDSEINALTTNDIEELANPGNETFTVTNSGTGSYVVDEVSNPTFNLIKGNTYTFIINAVGHPFWIQSASGAYSSGDVYSTGTTNLGTDNGTITWTIPLDAPNTLYYACQFHASMQGTINLTDPGNLYFTNQRAINAASTVYIPLASQQSIISTASAAAVTYLVDSAPGALDTLNELAAALNDDANFSTTITNSLATKLDSSSASTIYLTQTNASTTYSALGHNHTSDNITDFNEAAEDAASSLFIHANHTNITATYDDSTGQVILVGSAGTASASGGGSGSVTFTRWSKTYSASTSLIVGVDDNAFSLEYTPTLEQLFINGILQDPSNYTATNGTSISLNEALVASDVIEVLSVQSFDVANTYTQAQIDDKLSNLNRWVKTLSSSATVISGVDDNSLSLSYTPGNEQVFINGILLKETTDYTATSASVITLTEAAFENDTVEVINLTTINLASVYTQEVSDSRYILNSASVNFEPNIAYVSSSPSSPSAGTLWIDSTNSSAPALKVYNGSTWIAVSGTAETISPLLLMGG
jgi:plastocyanin